MRVTLVTFVKNIARPAMLWLVTKADTTKFREYWQSKDGAVVHDFPTNE